MAVAAVPASEQGEAAAAAASAETACARPREEPAATWRPAVQARGRAGPAAKVVGVAVAAAAASSYTLREVAAARAVPAVSPVVSAARAPFWILMKAMPPRRAAVMVDLVWAEQSSSGRANSSC